MGVGVPTAAAYATGWYPANYGPFNTWTNGSADLAFGIVSGDGPSYHSNGAWTGSLSATGPTTGSYVASFFVRTVCGSSYSSGMPGAIVDATHQGVRLTAAQLGTQCSSLSNFDHFEIWSTESNGSAVHNLELSWYPADHPNPPTAFIPLEQTMGPCTCAGSPSVATAATRTTGGNSAFHADPVNTATGSFTESVTDASLPARGVPFAYTRTYNSLSSVSARLGPDWSDPYQSSLSIGSSMSKPITLKTGDGGKVVFGPDGSGGFAPPPGIRSELVVVTGGYNVTNPNGVTSKFDSTGRLTSLVDRHNKGLTFTYNAAGKQSTITDANGHAVTLTYDTANVRLKTLTLPGSRTWLYDYYADGRLKTVTDPPGSTWTYTYDANGYLATMQSPSLQTVVTNVYDATSGRVTKQTDGRGRDTLFAWDPATETATTTYPDGGQWFEKYHNNVLLKSTDPNGHETTYSYDYALNLTKVVDPAGHETRYTYGGAGNLLKRQLMTPATQQIESWTYNTKDEPLTHTSFRQKTTVYTYNSSGDLASRTSPTGGKTSWTYNTDGTVATMVEPPGNVSGAVVADYTTVYGYDTQGQLTSVTDARGAKTTYGYDTSGRIKTVTDPRGNQTGAVPADFTTTYSWIKDDKLDLVTDPDGHTVNRNYNADRRLSRLVNENLHGTDFTYYPDGTVQTVTDADGHKTEFDTDYAGHVISVKDALGKVTTSTYDKAGNLKTVTTPKGNLVGADPVPFTTTYAYDALDRIDTISRPLPTTGSAVTDYDYDDVNRTVDITDPNVLATRLTYDADGNIISRRDASGYVTAYEYNDDGLLKKTIDPNLYETAYTYTADGLLKSRTDANTRLTQYDYTKRREIDTITAPDTSTIKLSYDLAGNVTKRDYSQTTTPDVTFTYDAHNRRRTMIDATGTSIFDYDPVGNLASAQNGAGQLTKYTYDAVERLKTLTYPPTTARPLGRVVTYNYKDNGLLDSLLDGSISYGFGYDDNANLTTTTFPNGVTETRGYDNLDRLNAIDATGSSSLLALDYDYDAGSRLITATEQLNGSTATRNFTYDDSDRLKTSPTGTYVTDAANQLKTLANGTTLDYDHAGQLQTGTTTAGTTNYSFNTRGDRTAVTPPSSGTTTSMTYSQADTTTNVTRGSTSASYTYNGDRLRQSATGSTTAAYTWDPNRTNAELLSDGTSSFIYGPAGPLVQLRNTDDAPTYIHPDLLGSTRVLSDATGNTTGTYSFDDYGAVTTHTGSTATLQYNGQYTDPATGLIYLRARDYDPTTAQFTTQDPLTDLTETPYAYAGNQPITGADPSGLCLLNLCESFQVAKGEVLGVYDVAKGAVTAVAHPIQTARNLVGACTTAYGENGGGGYGVLGCIDAMNPVAGIRDSLSAAYDAAMAGCLVDAGRSFSHALIGTAALAAPLLRAAPGAGVAAEAVPARLARVTEARFAGSPSLGPPGAGRVFVTAADDIEGITTSQGLAQRLTLLDDAGKLRQGPFSVTAFDTPAEGLGVPVFRSNPGFVQGGFTGGGAREFDLPNLLYGDLGNVAQWIVP